MIGFKSNRNVMFSCKYHVVFCPKYRRPVLIPPIDAVLWSNRHQMPEYP